MVNLAKLRKKAKEKKGAQGSGLGAQEHQPADSQSEPRAPRSEISEDKIAKYLETAGEIRVQTRREDAAPVGEQLELLTFVIAGEHYAIEIDQIVEIVTPRPVTRVPNADPSVVGILSLRGTIVMLVDARRRLRHPPAATNGDARIIVVQNDNDQLGFLVDRVLRVVKVDAAAIEPQPVVHSSEHDESVRGVFRQGDALTIVLDLSKLIFATGTEWN